MIGMIQFVAYLVAVYMGYRGITDALRDVSELPRMTGRAPKTLRIIAAICAVALVPATLALIVNMEWFASTLALQNGR